MKSKSQRQIINEASKRFKSMVQAGGNPTVAYNFYLATLKIDLKSVPATN